MCGGNTSLISLGAAEQSEHVLAYCTFFRASYFQPGHNKKKGLLIQSWNVVDQFCEISHNGQILTENDTPAWQGL